MPILDKETSVFPENLFDGSYEESDDYQWWAIFTKSRQEKALARDLLAKEIPFFLPLVSKENLVRGKVRKSYIPLFTGYMFMYTKELERVESLKTNRISTMLPVGDDEQLYKDLCNVQKLIHTDAPLTIERRIQPGQHVRIKSGPMEGMEGTVLARRSKVQLLVAVQFLQSGVSLEIDDFMLEPV